MTASSPLLELAGERYVLLTTFRRTGEPVATPVWIARYRDELLVTTPEGTGKLKRLRNNPRVELQAASRFGRPKSGSPVVAAAVAGTEAQTPALADIFRHKYRLEYRVFKLFEGRTKTGVRPRVVLHIG
ncbi:MAG: Pyridoxamine 5-phosphate oxidase [Microbacteriaceae bacterium]|nr:Pyridoxamine 5-phosphate oxidase [Microbacteriaceae bacterium]